jgi:hypothetical protein
MTRIVVDEALKDRLLGLHQPLELCDESGQVLARVLPAVDLSAYEPWEPQISAEEIRRRLAPGRKRYTTAEVLAYLESL